MNLPVYMDYHATTPVDQRVLEAMIPYFTGRFGNASSHGHLFGWQAAEAVKIAREQVASLIHADPSEIIFTSGATEAVNLAIKGAFELLAGKGKHLITVATEHRAVLDTCLHLEKMGADLTILPVDRDGLVDPEMLRSAIRPDTILITVMMANNETGVHQPIKEMAVIAREKNVLFFTDATQALGKIPIDIQELDVQLLACSAHKLYGPKGVGALYIRKKNPRVRLISQVDGGGQERGFRSGTLNVPGIVGFGQAAAIAFEEMHENMKRVKRLRDRLEQSLLTFNGAMLNGHAEKRLDTVSNISFHHSSGKKLLGRLQKDLAISSGSACSSNSPEPSHVLKAMGRDDEQAFQAIRFSLGKFNTDEEVDFVIQRVLTTLSESDKIIV